MPKYDVEIKFEFQEVEAEDTSRAVELCDEAMGTVIVEHPTTKEQVAGELTITRTQSGNEADNEAAEHVCTEWNADEFCVTCGLLPCDGNPAKSL